MATTITGVLDEFAAAIRLVVPTNGSLEKPFKTVIAPLARDEEQLLGPRRVGLAASASRRVSPLNRTCSDWEAIVVVVIVSPDGSDIARALIEDADNILVALYGVAQTSPNNITIEPQFGTVEEPLQGYVTIRRDIRVTYERTIP